MENSAGDQRQEGNAPVAESRDTGYAPEKWAFDGEVTRVFDDMLSRSIPQIEVMRKAVLDIADKHAKNDTHVIDLGASRGEATARLLDRRGAQLRYVLCETSKPMLEALRERFKGWTGLMGGRALQVKDVDLRREFPQEVPSVVLSVLTLMFVPIEHRQALLRKCYKALLPGGALVIVEKVLGSTADLDALFVDLYHRKKREDGYSPEEIDRKKLSLEGVLVPLPARMNEELLRAAGFQEIDCFWRWMNFCGWVAVKS